MDKGAQWNFWYVVLAILGVLVLQSYVQQWQQVEPLPYSEFLHELDKRNVKELQVYPGHIEGTLNQPRADGRTRFSTTRVELDLARDLSEYGVRFTGMVQSTFLRDLFSWVAPALIFFAIWMFAIRKIAGKGGLGGGLGDGLLAIGKSHAKVYVESDTRVTFDDVAGVDEAKAELEEVVDFLRDPMSHSRLGARMPKGILLVGPPGTGKTLLARAVAGQAGVPFFSINGSEFVEMFVGVGAARVRDLFEQARKHAPAIIFIDELDALGRARGAWSRAGTTRRSRPSTSCWPSLTASTRARAWCCWPRPTALRSWTRRCCAPGALIARCWWTGPTRRAGCTFCACI